MDTKISSKVQIYISARRLQRLRLLSALNPVAFLYVIDGRSDEPEYVGHTEVIKDVVAPDFQHEFMVDYFFEENQSLQIRMFHSEKMLTNEDRKEPSANNAIGQVEFCLGDMVSAEAGCLKASLYTGIRNDGGKSSQSGIVIARCEIVTGINDNITIEISGYHLDKVHCLFKSYPVLEFFRLSQDNSWQLVHRTEILKKTTNPAWKPMTMKLHTLCNNNEDRPLKLVVNDEKGGRVTLIGECETTFRQMCQLSKHKDLGTVKESEEKKGPATESSLFLTNPQAKRKGGSRYKNSGFLIVHQITRFQEPAFLDFIMGGLNVCLLVAIDFTASNGDPQYPDSLHYLDPKKRIRNSYERAISAIGSICGQYDSDQMFPVWGFGAKIRSTQAVSHMFPLTFNEKSEEVHGIDGVLSAYRNTFPQIQLSGPTFFSQVIGRALEIASEPYTDNNLHYEILLIITDGVVNDKQATIKKIIEASSKPLSIIIVGVGNADFSDMNQLDGDEEILQINGIKAERDIVQFVPMNKFRASETSRLATEVLAEVPHQVVSFMNSKNIKPKTRQKLSKNITALDLLFSGASDEDSGGDDSTPGTSPVLRRALSKAGPSVKPKLHSALARARNNLARDVSVKKVQTPATNTNVKVSPKTVAVPKLRESGSLLELRAARERDMAAGIRPTPARRLQSAAKRAVLADQQSRTIAGASALTPQARKPPTRRLKMAAQKVVLRTNDQRARARAGAEAGAGTAGGQIRRPQPHPRRA